MGAGDMKLIMKLIRKLGTVVAWIFWVLVALAAIGKCTDDTDGQRGYDEGSDLDQ